MLHSKLAPSSAARRLACPGSRELEERYPELADSPASREGQAAHWLAQCYLLGDYEKKEFAPNGVAITKEMEEGADLYEHEIKWMAGTDTSVLHIEERVNISTVHEDCWGTPDCWFVVSSHLYIYDYKFGHGFVDVYQNWQLLEYACGVMAGLTGIKEITLTVVQPRSYTSEGPIRSWHLTPGALADYEKILQESERKASLPNAQCIPSPECAHCLARHACVALQKTTARFIDMSNASVFNELTPLQTARELSHLHAAAELMEARITGLEEQAKNMILKGELVPGYKLDSSMGREAWTKDASEVIMLGELMGLNLAKPPEPITPVQARKLGLDEGSISAYSARTPGKLKLMKAPNAEKVFKK